MNELQIQRTNQIKQLLNELSSALKMSVSRAIKIGELLVDQKKELPHGKFTPWLTSNFSLSERSAQNYMKMYEYKSKTANVADLSSAYKLIDTLENEKRAERVLANPQEETAYQKRMAEAFTKKQKDYVEKLKDKQEKDKERSSEFEFITDTMKQTIDYLQHQESMALGNGNDYLQSNIFHAIDQYILSFNNPNDKIMAGQNIIKHVKEIVNSNQVKMVS